MQMSCHNLGSKHYYSIWHKVQFVGELFSKKLLEVAVIVHITEGERSRAQ